MALHDARGKQRQKVITFKGCWASESSEQIFYFKNIILTAKYNIGETRECMQEANEEATVVL